MNLPVFLSRQWIMLSFVQWTWADLQANGFKTEVMEYITQNGVSKDDVVLHMEKYPDATLEATIGTLKTIEAKPAVAEVLASEAQEVAPVVEEVAPESSEDSKLPGEATASE